MKKVFLILSLALTFSCSHLEKHKQLSLADQYTQYEESAYFVQVKGMICDACVEGLDVELKKDKRVEKVSIDLVKEEVFIKTSETNLSMKEHILNSLQVRGLDLLSIRQK